jgi:hypothetical protein
MILSLSAGKQVSHAYNKGHAVSHMNTIETQVCLEHKHVQVTDYRAVVSGKNEW